MKDTDQIYRHIIDFMPLPAMIHQDMKIAYANDLLAKNYGLESGQEMIGKPVLAFMSQEFLQVAKERIEYMLSSGKGVNTLIEKVVKENGEVAEVEITAFPIMYNNKPAIFLIANDMTPLKRMYDEIKKKNEELENARQANLNIIEDLALEIEEKKKVQEELKHSEEKFRTLFESSPDAVFIMKDGQFVDCNIAATKMFGCSKEEIIGKTPINFSPVLQPNGKNSEEEALKYISKANRGSVQFFEWKHIKLNGEEFDAEVKLTKFKLGREKYLSAIVRDITERKRITEKLKENEERFRTLAASTSTAIFVYQGENFIYGNKAARDLTGYTEEEFNKLKFWDVVHPDFKEVVRQRGLARQRGEKVDNRYEFKIITKKGEEKWIDFTAGVMLWEGKPAAIGSAFDITERKKAEEKLRESEERFRSMAELLPVAVFETDLNVNITYANKRALELFKYSEEDLKKGINGIQLIADKNRERARETLKNILNGGATLVNEYYAKKSDGTVFPVYFKTGTISKNGKIIGFRGIVEDITFRKRSENLLKIQYEIARAVLLSENTKELFEIVQKELSRFIDMSNFYYAEYDEEKQIFTAPFEKDEKDSFPQWEAKGSLTGYLLKKGKTLLLNKVQIKKLISTKKIKKIGTLPQQWLGAPIKLKGKFAGAIVLQNYKDPEAFDRYSKEIIEIISQQISTYLEQKKTEEEANKLAKAVQNSPSAIFITDPNWRIQYANPKLEEISGYSLNELIGRKTGIFKSGLQSDSYLEFMKKAVASGSTWEGEFINKRKDGEYFWVRSSVSPLLDENGKITNHVIVQEDITEKKRMENLLKESEAQFRSIWENSRDAMRLLNARGEFVDVNSAFCEMVGKSKEELIGKRYYVIYKDFDEKVFDEFLDRFAREDFKPSFEVEVVLWNGKKVWLELTNTFLKFGDRPSLLLSIIRDVTERREMIRATIEAKEKAEEMNRLKSQFFIYMSHELRTPFMGIMGYSQLLLDELKNEELRVMTQGILNTSRRMLNTLNNILDVTKLEFDQNEMLLEDINLGEVVLDVYDSFLQSAIEKNISLKKSIPDKEVIIKTDRRIVHGILENLVNNAIKFTEKGYVEIKLNSFEDKSEGKFARLVVNDTGIGIPKEKQKVIWEEFRQVSEGTARNYQGSGLGLTIVQKYVQMINGKIKLESDEGRGATFIVDIPLEKSSELKQGSKND